jgi:hypothetical protein
LNDRSASIVGLQRLAKLHDFADDLRYEIDLVLRHLLRFRSRFHDYVKGLLLVGGRGGGAACVPTTSTPKLKPTTSFSH